VQRLRQGDSGELLRKVSMDQKIEGSYNQLLLEKYFVTCVENDQHGI